MLRERVGRSPLPDLILLDLNVPRIQSLKGLEQLSGVCQVDAGSVVGDTNSNSYRVRIPSMTMRKGLRDAGNVTNCQSIPGRQLVFSAEPCRAEAVGRPALLPL